MKRLAIIAAALLLSAGGAKATDWDGNQLLRECTGYDVTDTLRCLAYIRGARDMLDALQMAGSGERCIPQPATLDQVKDVVVRYLRQHPEVRHFTRPSLIVAAVREAWCPDDSPTAARIPEQPQWKKVPEPLPVKKPAKPLPLDTE